MRIISGTSLLVLSVTYTDPVLAADMANAVAQALIAKSPTNLTPEQQEQRDSANAEIEDLKAQIQAADAELAALDQQLAEVTVANAERLELIRQRNALIEQKNSALSTIAGLRGTITQLELRANSLDIVEPARIPGASNSPSVLNTTLLGALVGAALAVGVALLVEYLDDTLKTPEETTQALALPILGTIVRFGKPDEGVHQPPGHTGRPKLAGGGELSRAAHQSAVLHQQRGQTRVYRDQPRTRRGQDGHYRQPRGGHGGVGAARAPDRRRSAPPEGAPGVLVGEPRRSDDAAFRKPRADGDERGRE
ncbi:MAG: hypothetical protein M5R40_27075 [Anaerolineae bacterium]|nr:hypothetical protein [Anaerolineae bacterium]